MENIWFKMRRRKEGRIVFVKKVLEGVDSILFFYSKRVVCFLGNGSWRVLAFLSDWVDYELFRVCV